MLRALLVAALPVGILAVCDCTLPNGQKKQMNEFACADQKGTCAPPSGDESGGGLLRSNSGNGGSHVDDAQTLGRLRTKTRDVICPKVDPHPKYAKMLTAIKNKCAGEDKSFVEGAMCKHDQCVVKGVSDMFHDHVNIMDCHFSSSVTEMCKKSPNAQFSPWAKCPTRMAAYNNENQCAKPRPGLKSEDGVLVVYPGFMDQTPQSIKKKFDYDDEGRKKAKFFKHALINNAAHFYFNHIMEKGCAVCATIAQAGFHAYKEAGLLGRLDIVEEEYSKTVGHIFLLYSTRDKKPVDPNNACPKGFTKDRCYTQFIDNWYAGLKPSVKGNGQTYDEYVAAMLNPPDSGFSVPYYLRQSKYQPQAISYHKQNKWQFHKKRNDFNKAVATWPKDPVPAPTGLPKGWYSYWDVPTQQYCYIPIKNPAVKVTCSRPRAGIEVLEDEEDAMVTDIDEFDPLETTEI